jgi:1-acyl-sn-glycerol-3-phosphate acyltransferase
MTGQFPNHNKFIAIVAPHTSNWDFIICMAFKLALGIEIRFLGKHSIFVGPLGRMLSHWGGIPVDRRSPHGTVGEVVKHFQQHSSLVLALAPEGTRHYKPEWKKGFLHMAQQANVPIVPLTLNFKTKQLEVLAPEWVSDDLEKSLVQIKSKFNKDMAKYPAQFSE